MLEPDDVYYSPGNKKTTLHCSDCGNEFNEDVDFLCRVLGRYSVDVSAWDIPCPNCGSEVDPKQTLQEDIEWDLSP